MRCLWLLLLICFAMRAHAQDGLAVLQKKAAVHAGIDAFPRVISNAIVSPEVAARINGSLDRFDTEMRVDWRDCLKTARRNADWSRSVAVTMRGPDYLSLLADDGFSCGGPHPEDSRLALVYDLKTGLPVNWERLLAPGAKGMLYRQKGRLPLGKVRWPAMLTRARQQSIDNDKEAECALAYEEADLIAFDVYLSAADHAIALAPRLTPHFASALCSTVVLLKAAEAKRLGISQALVAALENAR